MARSGPISPCINVCVLDDHGCCKGCRRTVTEIARWGRLSADEQWAVIARIERVRADERCATTAAASAAEG
jgi:predicted Fe-S protein YdhL (DUF1289 family)